MKKKPAGFIAIFRRHFIEIVGGVMPEALEAFERALSATKEEMFGDGATYRKPKKKGAIDSLPARPTQLPSQPVIPEDDGSLPWD